MPKQFYFISDVASNASKHTMRKNGKNSTSNLAGLDWAHNTMLK